jgi:hypothetical protein
LLTRLRYDIIKQLLDRPDRLNNRLTLSRQHLDLSQLCNNLLGLVMLPRHIAHLHNAAELSSPAAHF